MASESISPKLLVQKNPFVNRFTLVTYVTEDGWKWEIYYVNDAGQYERFESSVFAYAEQIEAAWHGEKAMNGYEG